jgi:hypothetical protein
MSTKEKLHNARKERAWLIKKWTSLYISNTADALKAKTDYYKLAVDLGHKDLANEFSRSIQLSKLCMGIRMGRIG